MKADARIAEIRREWLVRYEELFDGALSIAESPIEKLLLASFLQPGCFTDIEWDRLNGRTELALASGADGCLFVQWKFGEYTADFMLMSHFSETVRVVVECDGHEFHERTKAQARHDKKRDRAMVAAGLIVVRFTGSEIWADPEACREQAFDVLCKAVLRERQAREEGVR
jgi:very-short-patch-repair endonuclease